MFDQEQQIPMESVINSLNEAILFVNKWSFTIKRELCVFRVTKTQGDSNFKRATSKNTPF